jgi:hypothetical protein
LLIFAWKAGFGSEFWAKVAGFRFGGQNFQQKTRTATLKVRKKDWFLHIYSASPVILS